MIIPESDINDRTALDFLEPRPANQILDSTIPIPNELQGHAMVTSLDSLVGWARRSGR